MKRSGIGFAVRAGALGSLVLATTAGEAATRLGPESELRPPRNPAEQQARGNDLPRPSQFNGSASSEPHFASAKQASTWMEGPASGDLEIQVLDLELALGRDTGPSPWHVVSTRRYSRPDAVTVWGATLTDVYRIVVDGDRFEATDLFRLNALPISLTWNLSASDDGRVFVPDPDGRQLSPGLTSGPTLVVLSDDQNRTGDIDSPVVLRDALVLDREQIYAACNVLGPAELVEGPTGSNFTAGFHGEFATTAVFERDAARFSFLVIVNQQLEVIAAAEIGPTAPSNAIPAEPEGDNQTAFYVPTDVAIVKIVFDAARQTAERRWVADFPVRFRLGTTPTLMNTPDGERFVFVIDAKAAVVTGLNGLIAYSTDTRPTTLVAVRRDDDLAGRPRIITKELPDWLGAVENSPAARGGVAVICNYSGYLPNGLAIPPGGQVPPVQPNGWGESPDARPEFATGVVAVRYNPAGDTFDTIWANPTIQFNGIPAISESSNIVYGSGAEEATRRSYFYGLRLLDDASGPAGELVIRQEIGNAPFRTARRDFRGNFGFARSDYQLAPSEFFDAGNSLLILEDGSALVNGSRAIARIRSR